MNKLVFFSIIILLFSFCKNNSDKSESTEQNVTNKDLTPIDVVTSFIENLGKQKFNDAFDLQKNPNWKNYDKFISDKAFGGISQTTINKIEQKPDEKDKAVIFVDASYFDPINGDNKFEQKFFLQKFSGEWKIVDMKVTKTTKLKSEEENNFDNFLAEFKTLSFPIKINPEKDYTECFNTKYTEFIIAERFWKIGKFKINNEYNVVLTVEPSDITADCNIRIYDNKGKIIDQKSILFEGGDEGYVTKSFIVINSDLSISVQEEFSQAGYYDEETGEYHENSNSKKTITNSFYQITSSGKIIEK